jgi:hypothetical protein
MNTPRCRFMLPALAMLGVALAVVAPAGVATATPPGYLIVDIGIVQPADIASQGFRVSMTGIATGRSFGNPTRAFTWTSAGGLVGLPNLAGRTYCVGNGVNDLGDVVGTGATTSFGSSPLPVLWQGGVATQLPLPAGQSFGRANDINNAGLAVGSIGSGSVEYGVKWSGGVASVITAQTAGGCFLRTAFSVNDAGLVAGFGVDPANAARNVGFVYDAVANTATEVPPLPGPQRRAGLRCQQRGSHRGLQHAEPGLGHALHLVGGERHQGDRPAAGHVAGQRPRREQCGLGGGHGRRRLRRAVPL